MAYLPGQQYVKNASGIWTAVGFSAGSASQPVSLTSPNGLAAGLFASITAYGYQRVTTEPGFIFGDPFDGGTVDTTNRWTAVTGTVTQANGAASIGNTTISTTHALVSQPSFAPSGLNFNALGFVATLEASPLTTNVQRFLGFGDTTNGMGFYFDGAGKLWAAVFVAGVRSTSSVDISTSAVAGPTRYGIIARSDLVIFYVGTTEYPVASVSFVTPSVQTLPVAFRQINGATVTGTPTMAIGAVGVHDTGHNSTQISDGTYPWREATVNATGALSVNLASSSGVVPASTGTVSTAGVLGTLAGATSSTAAVVSDVSSSGNATIVLSGGTYTALTLAFEASIDTAGAAATWFTIDATRVDGSAIETQVSFTATGTRAWNIMAPGYKLVRVRVQAITQTVAPSIAIVPGPFLYDPSPTVSATPLVPLSGPSTSPGSIPGPAYLSLAVTTNTTVIAAPGAGLSIYVTDMEGSNAGASAVLASFNESTPANKYARYMAAGGGGFVTNLKTPWKLPANMSVIIAQSAAVQCYYTLNYYVAP